VVLDRRSKILEHVIDHERVDVNELADMFGVSQVTIRKDLDHLERNGLITREHGYAVAIAPDNLRSRLAFHHDIKRRIATAAAELVPNGATVMIESGSCCALLADELSRTRRGVTIITNSAFIADYVRGGQAAVILIGGDYQPESQVTVGRSWSRASPGSTWTSSSSAWTATRRTSGSPAATTCAPRWSSTWCPAPST
jgi:DeoR/GlpR family transcriptional regulator of sugar metabolism